MRGAVTAPVESTGARLRHRLELQRRAAAARRSRRSVIAVGVGERPPRDVGEEGTGHLLLRPAAVAPVKRHPCDQKKRSKFSWNQSGYLQSKSRSQ